MQKPPQPPAAPPICAAPRAAPLYSFFVIAPYRAPPPGRLSLLSIPVPAFLLLFYIYWGAQPPPLPASLLFGHAFQLLAGSARKQYLKNVCCLEAPPRLGNFIYFPYCVLASCASRRPRPAHADSRMLRAVATASRRSGRSLRCAFNARAEADASGGTAAAAPMRPAEARTWEPPRTAVGVVCSCLPCPRLVEGPD